MGRALGRTIRFVEIANDVIDNMPGSRVLLIGLTYKRNSGDARQSPAIVQAGRLKALGADLRVVEPRLTAAEMPDELVAFEPDEGCR